MEWAWGLRGLTRVADNGPTHTALDRLRGELRGELRSALLVAYLGPKRVPMPLCPVTCPITCIATCVTYRLIQLSDVNMFCCVITLGTCAAMSWCGLQA